MGTDNYNIIYDEAVNDYIYSDKTEWEIEDFFQPYINWALNKIQHLYQKNNLLRKNFEENLLVNLIDISIGSLILELNIHKLNQKLEGESKFDRLKNFIRKISIKKNREFFYNDYPILKEYTCKKLIYLTDFYTEIYNRYNSEYFQLNKQFNMPVFQEIEQIQFDKGDSHNRGRSVCILVYGTNKIVYKPKRSCTPALNNYLAWFENKDITFKFKTAKVLNCDKYCWEEFIERKSCDTLQEVNDFYYHLGGLLGVLYSINGIDYHNENIIANGKNPVLIDNETLFTSNFNTEVPIKIYPNNILSTGILPFNAFLNAEGNGIDISGVFGKSQLLPRKIPILKNITSDEIKYVYEEAYSEEKENVVKLKNISVKLQRKHVDYFISGFSRILNIIIINKKELINECKLLNIFKDNIYRVLLRNTQTYSDILKNLKHPDMIISASQRKFFLDNLKSYPLSQKKLSKYEKIDLERCDIPIFFKNIDSKDVISSDGEIIKDALSDNGYQSAFKKINLLNSNSIRKQCYIIASSFSEILDNEKRCDNNEYKFSKINCQNEDIYKEVIISGEKQFDFECFIYLDEKNITYGTLDNDFYSGKKGIFFTFLDQMYTNKKQYFIENKTTYLLDYSNLFMLTKLSEKELSENYEFYKKEIITPKLSFEFFDSKVDYISGSVGLLSVLIKLYKETKDNDISRYIQNLTLQLISKKKEILSMDITYAHGCIGVANVFIKVYELFGESSPNLRATIDELHYTINRGYVVQMENNDISWCKGISGFLLYYSTYYSYFHDYKSKQKIETGVKKIKRILLTAGAKDDSLCHGNIGILDVLLEIKRNAYSDEALEFVIGILKDRIFDLYNKLEFKSGLSNGAYNTSLFLGLSGKQYIVDRINLSISSILN